MSRAKLGGGGGGAAGTGLVNLTLAANLPPASAANANQAYVVVDDNGGRLLVSNGVSWVPGAAAVAEGAAPVVAFGAVSRSLAAADNGAVLEISTAGLTVSIPEGLPTPFRVSFLLLSGTTSFDPLGATLLNGGTATLTRAAGTNPLITLQSRTAANSLTLTGA